MITQLCTSPVDIYSVCINCICLGLKIIQTVLFISRQQSAFYLVLLSSFTYWFYVGIEGR